jgi:hypothetical protein
MLVRLSALTLVSALAGCLFGKAKIVAAPPPPESRQGETLGAFEALRPTLDAPGSQTLGSRDRVYDGVPLTEAFDDPNLDNTLGRTTTVVPEHATIVGLYPLAGAWAVGHNDATGAITSRVGSFVVWYREASGGCRWVRRSFFEIYQGGSHYGDPQLGSFDTAWGDSAGAAACPTDLAASSDRERAGSR